MELPVYNDEHFMKEAYKEALYAFEEDEIPVGAVVVLNNKIIARAHNQTERLNDVTAHAEMIAITSAANHLGSKYLVDCDLYITLEPCTMCAGAIFWSQMRRLVFAASDPRQGFTKIPMNVLHPRTILKTGVMATESEELIRKFFNKLRN